MNIHQELMMKLRIWNWVDEIPLAAREAVWPAATLQGISHTRFMTELQLQDCLDEVLT